MELRMQPEIMLKCVYGGGNNAEMCMRRQKYWMI